MELSLQLNSNDCGLIVTKYLIKRFFNKEISIEELYKYANITQEGISIADLEALNKRYGINLESYEMCFNEFKNYHTKRYFLLLLNKDEGHHYVIGKKSKKSLTIYDPAEGIKNLSYEELKNLYTNIFIDISYDKKREVLPEKLKENQEIYDLNKTWKLLTLNVIVFSLSIALTLLLKHSFIHISSGLDFRSLKIIIFSMAIAYLLFHTGEYLEKALTTKHKGEYSKSLHKYLLDCLKDKKPSFLQKTKQMSLLRTHIENIASYHAEYLNKWIISIVSLATISFLLLQIHWLFIFIILFSFSFQYALNYFYKKNQSEFLPNINDIKAQEKKTLYELEEFLEKELNSEKLPLVISSYSSSFQKELLLLESFNSKNIVLSCLNSLLNDYFYLLLFSSIAVLIYLNSLNFSYLAIITFLYSQINKAFSNLSNYYNFKNQYIYSKNIYRQLINIDSLESSSNTIPLPKAINIKDFFFALNSKIIFQNLNIEIKPHTLIYGPSGIGKSVLYKLISGKLQSSESNIYFDSIPLSELNQSDLKNTIIYQISNSYLLEKNIKTIINSLCLNLKEHVIHVCKQMNINTDSEINPSSLSSGQKQFLNILHLLKYSGKILLLDEIASHINLKTKIYIFKNLISYLSSRNFLICSEHNPELKSLFTNHINLNSLAISR